MVPKLPPFHLAYPVASPANVRMFYGNLPGCPEGRSSDSWADFDFHGHHLGVVLSMDAR